MLIIHKIEWSAATKGYIYYDDQHDQRHIIGSKPLKYKIIAHLLSEIGEISNKTKMSFPSSSEFLTPLPPNIRFNFLYSRFH